MIPVGRSFDKKGKMNLHFFLKTADLLKKVQKNGVLQNSGIQNEWEKSWEIGQSVVTLALFIIAFLASFCRRTVRYHDAFEELPMYNNRDQNGE